jgi:hypothetical protein
MTPPVYATADWLAARLGTTNEALLLLVIFGFLNLLLPAAIALAVAWLSRSLAEADEPLRVSFSRFVPALVPLGFAVWFAHYGFHFATGALGIIPATHNFLIDHGILIFGETPAWQMSNIVPFSWLLPLQVISVIVGFGGSYFVLSEIGRHAKITFLAQLPWLLLLLAIAVAAIYLFTLPMEMRGTGFMH